MNPEDIGRILDEIGERIGPAGEYAWTITVRQVYLEGVTGVVIWTVVALAALVGGIVLFRLLRISGSDIAADILREIEDSHRRYPNIGKNYVESDTRKVLENHTFGGGIALTALSSALLVAAIAGSISTSSAMKLLNPEYYAMFRLLERLVP